MKFRTFLYALFFCFLIIACSDEVPYNENNSGRQAVSEDENGCKFDDGTHSATVDYYNPSTGHNATYSLEVEIENCEVTTIYFPNGGWLDNSHIFPAELNEDGEAELEDKQGRTFSVHIDN